MHSCPIMVESMSARNRRLRRVAAGWTMTSTGAPLRRGANSSASPGLGQAGSGANQQVRGDAGIQPVRRRVASIGDEGPCASARDKGIRDLRPRGIGDQRGDELGDGACGRWGHRFGHGARTEDAGKVTGRRSMAERPRAILIAGPTASGKSALAIALARRLGGAVVNADSMQVYRDLRIITARPTRRGGGGGAAPAVRPCRCGREPLRRPLDGGDADRRWPTSRRRVCCPS